MLAAHPGIGFVVVATEPGRWPSARKAPTTSRPATVVGVDPLALFGPDAVGDFLRASRRTPTPPTSTSTRSYDPVLDEVAAFEELVGLPRRPGRLADPTAARAPGGVGDRRGPARRPRPAARGGHGAPPARALARAARPPHEPGTGRAGGRRRPRRRPPPDPGAAPLAQAGTGSDDRRARPWPRSRTARGTRPRAMSSPGVRGAKSVSTADRTT